MADFAASLSAAMAAPAPTPAPTTPAVKAAPEKVEPAKIVKKAEPAKAEPAKEPAEAQKKIWKLKADGEEFEFDASNEDAVKAEIMKARGSNKRFAEAQKLEKEASARRAEAEEAFSMLRDPVKLKKLLADPSIGVDFKKLAMDTVWEQMQDEALTPEQRRTKDMERELAKYKETELTAKQKAEAADFQAEVSKHEAQIEQTIMGALEHGGIPKSRGAVRRMAHYMELAVNNNMEVTMQDLAARVKQDLQEEHRDMYESGDATTLVNVLGEGLAKKLRQADVQRLKSTQPTPRAAGNAKPAQQGEKRRKTIDRDDLAAGLAERFKNGI